MRGVEERVSYLEAKMDEFSKSLMRLENAISALDQKMDHRFDRVETRFYWMIGIQFATLIAIIGGMFGVIAKLI